MSTATLSWTLPTTRQDDTPLTLEEILHTEVSMSANGGADWGPDAFVLPGDEQTFEIGNLSAGTYNFRVQVIDTELRPSGYDETSGSVLAPPAPITDLMVTIE